jgi:putative thioredoxin
MSAAGGPHIVATSSAGFERDVIERSKEVPVVVDFWADWCGPCRLLTPVLERLADEYAGRFLLVKADTEAMPEVAAAFGVRSIPAVFGFRDGQVVDGFVGVLPEAQIRDFLDRLMPSPAEQLTVEARALEATDPAAAEAKYREAQALDPNDPRPTTGLARLAMAAGRLDEAGERIAELEARGFLEPEAEAVQAELTLKRGMEQAPGGVEAARAALAADPNNLSSALTLVEALAGERQYAEALEIALGLVERDRKGVGEEARKLMLAIFNVLPPDSDLAADYRRRLSTAL